MKIQAKQTSRRGFLKTAGVTLASGLAATRAFSGNEFPLAQGQCPYSALPADFVYLNSGTEGSMPDCVLSTFQQGLAHWASDPTTSYELDPVFGKHQVLNREKVGRFLGAEKNNFCLTDNTTMGLAMTLMGLNFRPGDRVIMTNHEHNAIQSPLQVLHQRTGLQVETRAFPPAHLMQQMNTSQLLDALFPDIPALRGARALCASHVYPTTGVRLPLRALREKADELKIQYLVIDGAQALGMVDLTAGEDNLKHSDFYAAPGHKWLNGPPSTGVLYLRDADIRPPDFYPALSQRMLKYGDCEAAASSCFPMAEALQVRGNSNTPGFAAMVEAMKFAGDAGGSRQIEQHILGLSSKVRNIIEERAPNCLISPHQDSALHSGLTAFFPFKWDQPQSPLCDQKTTDQVVKALLQRKIQVRSIGFLDAGCETSTAEKSYAIRVSTAHFNTTSQVEIFNSALKEVLARL